MVDVHGGNDSAVELAWWDPDVLTEANIVPSTGLATDYLNVFNEAVMLFGLLSDMPDMIEELRNWQPMSYEKHFARSGFQAKDFDLTQCDDCLIYARDAHEEQP